MLKLHVASKIHPPRQWNCPRSHWIRVPNTNKPTVLNYPKFTPNCHGWPDVFRTTEWIEEKGQGGRGEREAPSEGSVVGFRALDSDINGRSSSRCREAKRSSWGMDSLISHRTLLTTQRSPPRFLNVWWEREREGGTLWRRRKGGDKDMGVQHGGGCPTGSR